MSVLAFGGLVPQPDKVNNDIISDRMEKPLSPNFFYPNEVIPTIKELAEKYGDANGQKIYRGGIYYKWLDKAFLYKKA